MIGHLIALLFLGRDLAHREHLKAQGPGSFARHKALNDFYINIIELADNLAEAYQGRQGKPISEIPLLENKGDGEIAEQLRKQLDWIEANRYEAVKKTDTPLQNIIDEICGEYLSALYMLSLK
jgi:DNA-binding ferritin-like protein